MTHSIGMTGMDPQTGVALTEALEQANRKLGGAWRMIVAGEMLASETGIGFLLMEARFQFRAGDLMMAMILISIVGYTTERLIVGTIERRTIRKWEVK